MKTQNLDALSDTQIVSLFRSTVVELSKAAEREDNKLYNKHYNYKRKIVNELSSRHGDKRRLLVTLLSDENLAVRYFSATATLTIDRSRAENTLEFLKESGHFFWSFEAAGTLRRLKDGTFVPS